MKLSLSDRLLACAGFVHPGDRVADVGCDHGYLGIYLLATGSRPALPPGDFWIEERARDRYAMPRLVERLLETLP